MLLAKAPTNNERAYYNELSSIPLGESQTIVCVHHYYEWKVVLSEQRGKVKNQGKGAQPCKNFFFLQATSGRGDKDNLFSMHARPRICVSTFDRYQGCFQQLQM